MNYIWKNKSLKILLLRGFLLHSGRIRIDDFNPNNIEVKYSLTPCLCFDLLIFAPPPQKKIT